ncbi:MAG TPA: glycoside hydrolase family 3 N-terminal domain-containing protein [Candidatus Dormibacteraeota bacterium]|nr:glycoside hydrolase family 3 N-terminal domain-containing protein [Candidatus Dormibacteraeota bacterium]
MTSIERLALRCLLPGFGGTVAPDWVMRRAAGGLGGVVLYGRNIADPDQLASLTASLHAERPDLLIAIDEEGGDVTRLEAKTGSSYPGNLALGAAGDPRLTREVAASMGAELSAAGVDLDLAPDADVNSNPSNPVIGTRAFGPEASVVATHTSAWVEGLQSAGVAACAKHFPGHGDTSVDSHLALPVVTEDPHQRALAPFKAAIASGVQAIMSAHILVPAIDDVPGTISRRIMTDLLRGELHFQGVAITDGLEMRGLSDGYGVAEGGVRALIAGCDALCIGGGLADEDVVAEISAAIVAAVEAGRLTQHRLAEAAGRVDALAVWRSHQIRGAVADHIVGLVAARRAIKADGPVRIGDDATVVQVNWSRSIAAGKVSWGMAQPLARRGVRVTPVEVHDGQVDVGSLLARGEGQSLVLVVRDLHRHAWQSDLADSLLAQRPDAVVVEMGLPQCRPKGAKAYIATSGAARVCGEAAAEVMRP